MENLIFGLISTVISVTIVFTVLAAILGIIAVFRFAPSFFSTKPHAHEQKGQENLLPETTPGTYKEPNAYNTSKVAGNVQAELMQGVIPDEIIAVITASISAQLSHNNFTVRSVRRVNSWNEMAKREQQRRVF